MAQGIQSGAAPEDGCAAKLAELHARALAPLIGLILEHFVRSLPTDAAAIMCPSLQTTKGRAAFRAKRPVNFEGYFEALRARERGSDT